MGIAKYQTGTGNSQRNTSLFFYFPAKWKGGKKQTFFPAQMPWPYWIKWERNRIEIQKCLRWTMHVPEDIFRKEHVYIYLAKISLFFLYELSQNVGAREWSDGSEVVYIPTMAVRLRVESHRVRTLERPKSSMKWNLLLQKNMAMRHKWKLPPHKSHPFVFLFYFTNYDEDGFVILYNYQKFLFKINRLQLLRCQCHQKCPLFLELPGWISLTIFDNNQK